MFGQPTEQRIATAIVVSPAMVGEVTIDNRDNVRDRNSDGLPVGGDIPESEGWAKAVAHVQIANPTAVNVEVDFVNEGHHLAPTRRCDFLLR
jgi:hypothetical protein